MNLECITPRFSIIVPVYNVEAYVEDCVNSIFNQTYKNFELILVDDGSTDASLKKCERFLSEKKNLTILQQGNHGPNVARNLALENAKGSYILFVDADDILESRALEVIECNIGNDEYDMINFGFNFFDDVTKKIKTKMLFERMELQGKNIAKEALLAKNIVGVCWNKCFKREFLKINHLAFLPDKLHGRDIIFTRSCAINASKVLIISEVLYQSRCRDRSFSRSFSVDNIYSAIDLAEKHKVFLHFLLSDEFKGLINYAIGKHLRYILILSAFRSIDYRQFRQHLDLVRDSPYQVFLENQDQHASDHLTLRDKLLTRLLAYPLLLRTITHLLKHAHFEPY